MVTPRKPPRAPEALEWLTLHEVARLLDVSASTVRGWIAEGLVVHELGPRTHRIARTDLDAYLATRRTGPPAEAVG